MPEPELVPLWPDGLPDQDIQHAQPEQTVNRDADQNAHGLNRAISSVIDPGLFVYPANSKNSANSETTTGDVVLVCPGGGYHHVTVDKEGHDVATWLNSLGISAVVLKYRTRPEGYAKTKALDDPVLNAILRDGQEAMRAIRLHAGDWNIKLTRLGVMGFSAGAHLAIRLAMTASDHPDVGPDFLALLYSAVPANAGDAVTPD
jgi:acetyl esterase/lipase